MNRMRLFIAIGYVCLSFNGAINTCSGCHQKSMDLAQEFDPKEYHHVICNCPCDTLRGAHNTCPECRHVHIPQHVEVVSGNDCANAHLVEKFAAYLESPSVMLDTLVEKNR